MSEVSVADDGFELDLVRDGLRLAIITWIERTYQHPDPVVVVVAEAAGGSVDLFDLAVDGLDRAGGGVAGAEVGEHLAGPAVDGAGEPGDLGDVDGGGQSKNRSSAILAAKMSLAA